MRIRIIPIHTNGNQIIQNENPRHINLRDQQSIRLIILEIIAYIFTNIPYSIYVTYSTITANNVKTTDQIRIESFINYLVSPCLIIINNCIPFYLFFLYQVNFEMI